MTITTFDNQVFCRSKVFVWALVLLETLVDIPFILTSVFVQNEREPMNVFFSSVIVIIALFIAVSGWTMLYNLAQEHFMLFSYRVNLSIPVGIFCSSTTLFRSVILLMRIWTGECTDAHRWFETLLCNPYESSHLPPFDSVMLLAVTPILMTSIFSDGNFRSCVGSWVITMITFALTWYMLNNMHFANTFCIYTVFSVLIIGQNYCRTMTTQEENKKLTKTIEENILLLEETRATDMRHMIANVAHDLKTPLSSFMFGIDLIAKELDSYQKQAAAGNSTPSQNMIDSIESCLQNIRITNNFMLMTINRCIDYTKASKGLKLTPKYETIDLAETLKLPLSCMMNIQSKVSIQMNPFTDSICTHIITDKQWLQENILCLLSNAVKYSTDGNVFITASLVLASKTLTSNSNNTIPTISRIVQGSTMNMQKDCAGTEAQISHDVTAADPFSREKPVFHHLTASSSTKIYPGEFLADNTSGYYHVHGIAGSDNSIPIILRSQVLPSLLTPRDANSDCSTQLFSGRSAGQKDNTFPSVGNSPFQMHRRTLLKKEDSFTHHLLFEIEDTGIGVSEEAMSSLFNPFKQTQRLAGGTGLGLYSLAKRVEALNGHYGVKKRKDGTKGTLFWFSIPYKADMVTASSWEQQAMKNSIRDSILLPTTDEFLDRAIMMPVPLAQQEQSTKQQEECNLHILLAEDSHTIAKMTSMMLKRQGYKVTLAENGELAVKLIMDSYHADEGKVKYDVVLMDLQMPVMDGLEATRRLRQIEEESHLQYLGGSRLRKASSSSVVAALSPKNVSSSSKKQPKIFPHVLVIGVSANYDHETIEEAYQAGIDAFIAKPFAIDTFTETFHNLIYR